MAEYAVVVTKTERNYSAYVPDLPGCIATGVSRAQVLQRLEGAIRMHVQGLREDGLPIPSAKAKMARVKVSLRSDSKLGKMA
jgi:predicted RNase H-like HicB family nuclease